MSTARILRNLEEPGIHGKSERMARLEGSIFAGSIGSSKPHRPPHFFRGAKDLRPAGYGKIMKDKRLPFYRII